MTVCFRARPERVAIWEKPPSGDRMAPFDDPVANFDLIRFCSDFQYLSSAIIATDISVDHNSVAGVDGAGLSIDASGSGDNVVDGQVGSGEYEIYEHGLGYVPYCFLVYEGQIVTGTTVVQIDGTKYRTISVYADVDSVYIKDVGLSTAADLPACTRVYDLYIFRDPAPDPSLPALRVKPDLVIFGQGKITSEQRPLRRVAEGDATLYLSKSRSIDIGNGAIRTISPIAGTIDLGTYQGYFYNTDAVTVTL